MRKTWFFIVLMTLVVAAGVIVYLVTGHRPAPVTPGPQYINLTGNYAFTIPADYQMDEKTLPEVQLLYPATSPISVKTIDDGYSQGMISVQGLNTLNDRSTPALKKFLNGDFLSAMKKISNDVKISYSKIGKWDVARVTAKSNGKVVRFVYVINDKHPAIITAQAESPQVKFIEESLSDIEDSNVNDEQKKMRQELDNILLYIKGKKAQDLYNNAATELKSKNSLSDVDNALKSLAPRVNANAITFYGFVYSGQSFSVSLNFWDTKTQSPTPVAFGSLLFTKENGQWRLQQMSLPAP